MLKSLSFFLLAFIALTGSAQAHGWHNHYDMAEDEVNPTDSLAISSDSSEVELDAELEDLEKMSEHSQEKK
jgi:hypothetical protein